MSLFNKPPQATKTLRVLARHVMTQLELRRHAIELANDIQYGLSSYVWTENIGRAHRVAARIEAGMCFVNSQNVRDLRQPFGGTKASGTGREGGTWSYEAFCEPKNISVSMGSHHIPHWGL